MQVTILQMGVYQAHLFHFPITIIKKLNGMIANFIWSSMKNNNKHQLSKLDHISMLKPLGGLGILNLRRFGYALLLKSLWIGIVREGTQGMIIKHKYLKDIDFLVWLHRVCIGCKTGFVIWLSFTKFYHYFLSLLTWKMGTGQDNIQGLAYFDKVLNCLIHRLKYKGIQFWQQVISTWHDRCPIWQRSKELGLNGPATLEWGRLRTQLQLDGIGRDAERYMIIWRGKINGTNIMVADTYHILWCQEALELEVCWSFNFRNTNIPSKITLFLWLVWKNKNLTWAISIKVIGLVLGYVCSVGARKKTTSTYS